MAQFWMRPQLPQGAMTGRYSVLDQERRYLLDALAEEEDRGTQLTQILMALQAQIDTYEAINSPGNPKKLRQRVKTLRKRIGACQHRERALAMNLAGIVAQIEGMKRYQMWNSQQDYIVQLQQAQQHAQMVVMSPARPAFALRSPANIDLAAQMRYMSLAPSCGPVFGNRTSLDQYMGTSNQPFVTTDMLSAFPEYTDEKRHSEALPMSTDMATWSDCNRAAATSEIVFSPMSAVSFSRVSPTAPDSARIKSATFGRQRASSMLESVHEHQSSGFTPNCAVRRLSLLDGGAALKLEREAARERIRILASCTR